MPDLTNIWLPREARLKLRSAFIAAFFWGVPRLYAQADSDTGIVRVIGTYYAEVTTVPGAPAMGQPPRFAMSLVIMADSAALDQMRHHPEYGFSAESTPACWISAPPGYALGWGHWHPGRADTIRVEFGRIDYRDEFRLAVGRDSISGVEW